MTATAHRAGRLRLLLLSASLLGLPSAAAQTTAPSAPSPTMPSPATPNTTAPGTTPSTPRSSANVPALTGAEKAALQALFAKARPATVRIEQCVPTDCDDPDGVGSGVFISADGLVLTAYHVVEGAKSLSVQTLNKTRYPVSVVVYDDQHDLALLRVNIPGSTPFLPITGTLPKVGDAVLAIGNGGGDFLTQKTGRLLRLDADAGRADFPPGTLEMSAPLIPGDSGGPILNADGQLTGIISYISVNGRNRTTRAYAVPVTATAALLTDMRAGVKRDAPVIGIGLGGVLAQLTTLDADDFQELSRVMKLGDTPGAFFTSVAPGSPAAQAGLVPLKLNSDYEREGGQGDIVTAVNGKRIINFSEFQYAVRTYAPGDTITLTILRGGKSIQVKVKLVGRSTVSN